MQRKGKQGRAKHRVDRKQEHCVGAHMLARGCKVKVIKRGWNFTWQRGMGEKEKKKKKTQPYRYQSKEEENKWSRG